MSNAEPQSLPDGVTKQDLSEQTAEVKQSVIENAQTVIDRVDENATKIRSDAAVQAETVRIESDAHAYQAASDHKMDMLLERMGTNEARTKIEVNSKFNRYFLFVVVAFVLLLGISTVNYFQILNPRAGQPLLTLSEITVDGPTDLCPGNYLDFSFDMDVQTAGVYELDMSVFRTSPPPSIAIFSEKQVFVITTPRKFTVIRHWQIPPKYVDEQTNEIIDFVSGNYERNIAVSTTSRSTVPSTRVIPFSIKDGCPKG